MTATYVAMLITAIYCDAGNQRDRVCEDGSPAHVIEMTVLDSGDCPGTTQPQDCKFDYLAKVTLDGNVVATIPVPNPKAATMLYQAMVPMFDRPRR